MASEEQSWKDLIISMDRKTEVPRTRMAFPNQLLADHQSNTCK